MDEENLEWKKIKNVLVLPLFQDTYCASTLASHSNYLVNPWNHSARPSQDLNSKSNRSSNSRNIFYIITHFILSITKFLFLINSNSKRFSFSFFCYRYINVLNSVLIPEILTVRHLSLLCLRISLYPFLLKKTALSQSPYWTVASED